MKVGKLPNCETTLQVLHNLNFCHLNFCLRPPFPFSRPELQAGGKPSTGGHLPLNLCCVLCCVALSFVVLGRFVDSFLVVWTCLGGRLRSSLSSWGSFWVVLGGLGGVLGGLGGVLGRLGAVLGGVDAP